MPYEISIACLANSRKPPSGRCVAGREYHAGQFGDWVRPVSARPTREVSLEERRYTDGRDPQVLDIMTIRFDRPEPEGYQRENHIIDSDTYWTRAGEISWTELQRAVEDLGGPLWLNGDSSTYGENDRVADAEAARFGRSLYLIRPTRLGLLVAAEGGGQFPARRRVRARFQLGDYRYSLVVTDPPIEAEYLGKPNGEYHLADVLLCISLGEQFHGHAYKLAAAVITSHRRGTTP